VYPDPLRNAIDELGRLPGIGPKNAARLAFHLLLKTSNEDATRFADAIVQMKAQTTFCPVCCSVAANGELCGICADDRRDPSMICVVQDPRDLVVMERSGTFAGRYHVLHGGLSPLEGIGPDQLRIAELEARCRGGVVDEVILCTNPNVEGDTTALYLAKVLGPLVAKVTKIASGVPVGGDLEYADEMTIGRAFEGRRDLEA
jgi:recombination protein RecR